MIVLLTIIIISMTICMIIVILIIPQISRLGENVFITKLPNLQKISLRHCGIKVLNILNEEIMTDDKYDKYENESKGRRKTHTIWDLSYNIYYLYQLLFKTHNQTIHESAFNNLKILVEIDLSYNNFTKFAKRTFR